VGRALPLRRRRGQLATFAREVVANVTGPIGDRFRNCAADDCALAFMDTSRSCGNRHKLRTHRAGRRDDD
jgi:predicted RNA-binding Zn ribbon-like protein